MKSEVYFVIWEVLATDEYTEWFGSLDGESQETILTKVLLLEKFGSFLGRPHADTLKGSSFANLKELRSRTASHILRVKYYFDEDRKALLLLGGDKKGKNEKSFYRNLISSAEAILQRYRK